MDNNYVTVHKKPVSGTAWMMFGGIGEIANYSIDPADTPILFRLKALGLTPPANKYAYAKVLFTGLTWGVGATVTIYGRTFTAATYPKAGQFYASFGSDISVMIDSLATAINADPFLGNLFSATRVFVPGSGRFLEIVAKQAGSTFNLTTSNLTSSISGFAANTACTPTNDSNRAQQLQEWGYGMAIRILVPAQPLNVFDAALTAPGTARWYEIGSMVKDYGGSDTSDFNVAKHVRAFCEIGLPDPASVAMKAFPQAAAAYKVEWGEYFRGGTTTDTPPMPALALTDAAFKESEPIFYRSGESEIRWAAPGAFPLDAVPADYYRWWRSISVDGLANVYTTVLPLTERPATALVRRFSDPHWLYFWLLVDKRGSSYKVRIQYYYLFHDGTNATVNGAQWGTFASGMFALHNNPNLALAETGGKRVASYVATVQVDRATGTFADLCSQSFRLDTSMDAKTYRTFYWANRFGTLDSFTFEGIAATQVDRAGVTFERGISQERGLNAASGKTRSFEQATTTRQTAVSGWIDRAHQEYLAGLLRSLNIYVLESVSYYDETLGRQATKRAFVSVVLTNQEWKSNGRDKLFLLSLEWQKATPEISIQA